MQSFSFLECLGRVAVEIIWKVFLPVRIPAQSARHLKESLVKSEGEIQPIWCSSIVRYSHYLSPGPGESSAQIAGVQVCCRGSHLIKNVRYPLPASLSSVTPSPDVTIWPPYWLSLCSLKLIHSQDNKAEPQVFVRSAWHVPYQLRGVDQEPGVLCVCCYSWVRKFCLADEDTVLSRQ